MFIASELVQFICFVEAAHVGSIAGAASRMGIGQAAVSSNLRKLEMSLGSILIERTRRGITLTAAGIQFLPEAREIVSRAQSIRGDMLRYGKAIAGRLRIGLPPIAARALAGKLMRFALDFHPDVQVCFVEGYSSDVRDWLEAGSIDIGLFYKGTDRDLPFARPVATEELLVVGAAHLFLDQDEEIDIQAVFDLPLVLPGLPHGHRTAIERLAALAKRELNIILEVDSLGVLIGVLEAGGGAGLLPLAALPSHWAERGFRAIPVKGGKLTRILMMGTPVYRPISRVADTFLPIVQSLCGVLDMGSRHPNPSS